MVRSLEEVMKFVIGSLDTIYSRALRRYCHIFGHDWYGIDCLRCGKYLDKY